MHPHLHEHAPGSRRGSAWLVAHYAEKEQRIDLIARYNLVAGSPSAAVAQVQHEFLHDRMEPAETVAFVGVCESLISSATRANRSD